MPIWVVASWLAALLSGLGLLVIEIRRYRDESREYAAEDALERSLRAPQPLELEEGAPI